MLTKDATGTSNRISLGMKCGDCIHLDCGPAAFEKVCSQLGKASFSEACPAFTPNLREMTFVKKDQWQVAVELFSNLSPKQTRLMAFSLRNIDFIKRAGFNLGEEVVFSVGGDYLACYVRGIVIGADRVGEQIYLTSDFESLNGGNCFLTLLRPSVLNKEAFAKHRAVLIKEGRIAEPKPSTGAVKRTVLQCLKMSTEERALYRKQLQIKPDDYTPPTLDTVPSKWLDSRTVERLEDPAKTKTKTRKGSTKDDGFTIQRYADKSSKTGRSGARRK